MTRPTIIAVMRGKDPEGRVKFIPEESHIGPVSTSVRDFLRVYDEAIAEAEARGMVRAWEARLAAQHD